MSENATHELERLRHLESLVLADLDDLNFDPYARCSECLRWERTYKAEDVWLYGDDGWIACDECKSEHWALCPECDARGSDTPWHRKDTPCSHGEEM